MTYSTFSLCILCLYQCWSYSGHQMLILCVEFLEESRIYVCRKTNLVHLGGLRELALHILLAFVEELLLQLSKITGKLKKSKWNSVILIFLGCQPGQFSLCRTVGVQQTLSGQTLSAWIFWCKASSPQAAFMAYSPHKKMWLVNRCGGNYPIENSYNP